MVEGTEEILKRACTSSSVAAPSSAAINEAMAFAVEEVEEEAL